MKRITTFRFLAAFAVFALLASQFSLALAARMVFDGETEDHFWDIAIGNNPSSGSQLTICQDGFIMTATEKQFSSDGFVESTGDGLAFSLQLASSNLPLRDTLPARIAGGNGTERPQLVSGSRTFLFSTLQSVGTQVQLSVERWDHGLPSAVEPPPPPGDESDFDDQQNVTEIDGSNPVVSNCYVDTSAPSIVITLTSTTQSLCASNAISKQGVCTGLLASLKDAKNALAKGDTAGARQAITDYLNKLRAQKGKSISLSAYGLLSGDAQFLLSKL